MLEMLPDGSTSICKPSSESTATAPASAQVTEQEAKG